MRGPAPSSSATTGWGTRRPNTWKGPGGRGGGGGGGGVYQARGGWQ